jgi:acetate kinase
MRVLVVNAGSSTLKLSVLDGDERAATETLPLRGRQIDLDALRSLRDRHAPIDAVGHRIVHGGTTYVEPVLVDDRVVRDLDALTDLAPLHQPKSLGALAAVSSVLPDVPAVACFDTAFHARIPAAASTYALPAEWRARWPLRRFGFHGLSHAYAARRAAELDGRPMSTLRVVTCHLGAGASLAAVQAGRSVDTTMGFTPLEGLVMATRSGSVDPGLVLWLADHAGMPPGELASTLEHRSGLTGLAGTGDMQEVLRREENGDPDARLGLEVYVHRLRAAIAAMAAAMGGLDLLVFTGGVGERAPEIRWLATRPLGFLGIALDMQRNAAAIPDTAIGTGDAVGTYVVEAREDLEIARGVRQVLGSPPG